MMSQQTQHLSFENTNILLDNTSEVNITKQQESKAKKLTAASTYSLPVSS